MFPETQWPFAPAMEPPSGTRRLEGWETRQSHTHWTAASLSSLAAEVRSTPSLSNKRNIDMLRTIKLASAIAAASFLFVTSAGRAAGNIRVMILDGESAGAYHQW